ncbi:MAG: hypothetical protein ACRDAX_08310 [Propionibacteriaceae bacterium]
MASANAIEMQPKETATPTVVKVSDYKDPYKYLVASGDGWDIYSKIPVQNVNAMGGNTGEDLSTVTPTGVNFGGCNWGGCKLVLSRTTTRQVANGVSRYANLSAGAIAGAFGVACAPIGGVGAAVCAGLGYMYGGYAIDQFIAARNEGNCISVRYNPIIPAASSFFGIDNSSACHD